MTEQNENIRRWEQVEIQRSASEASHTDLAVLRADEKNIARYMNPPSDTCFPLEYAYHLLGDIRGKVVFDFGCGSGGNTLVLARRGARVISMDISESLINVARQRLAINQVHGSVQFVVSSAHDVALEDESVDVIFGIAILHHLELPLVAREVKRVLRKGGRAIFQEPVRNSKFVSRVRGMIPYKAADVSPFERPLTDDELEDFAGDFLQYRSRAFCLPYINLAQVLPVARNYIFPLYRIDRSILKKYPRLAFYATVCVFEVTK